MFSDYPQRPGLDPPLFVCYCSDKNSNNTFVAKKVIQAAKNNFVLLVFYVRWFGQGRP